MYQYGLPAGCLSLLLGVAAAGLALGTQDEAAWVGLGAAAGLWYAGVMLIHRFEESAAAVRRGC